MKRRILCIDGGGIRGVIALRMLEELHQADPEFLSSVTTFAGTSTGAIIAAGLATGRTPSYLLNSYHAAAPDVFKDSFGDNLRDMGNLLGARYSQLGLNEWLAKEFGRGTLGDVPRELIIPTVRYQYNRYSLKVFHNFSTAAGGNDSSTEVRRALLFSTAAPTYFPAVTDGGSRSQTRYVDGGLLANNPSFVALVQCGDIRNEQRSQLEEITILSLGCGEYIRKDDPPGDWGLLKWSTELIPAIMGSQLQMMDVGVQTVLQGLGNYQRIQPGLNVDYPLDAWEEIPMMLDAVESTIRLTDWQFTARRFRGEA